jgi:hypothetical protein
VLGANHLTTKAEVRGADLSQRAVAMQSSRKKKGRASLKIGRAA